MALELRWGARSGLRSLRSAVDGKRAMRSAVAMLIKHHGDCPVKPSLRTMAAAMSPRTSTVRAAAWPSRRSVRTWDRWRPAWTRQRRGAPRRVPGPCEASCARSRVVDDRAVWRSCDVSAPSQPGGAQCAIPQSHRVDKAGRRRPGARGFVGSSCSGPDEATAMVWTGPLAD